MIEATNLHYQVGSQRILDDVGISVRQGELAAILGPNGSGKSTLLRCLIGTQRPDLGEIRIDGRSIGQYSLRALAAKRAVLMQSNVINFPFTAMEVVMMGRHPYVDWETQGADVKNACEAMALTDAEQFKDRLYPTLSGGEQQRVQLARVLAQILDRPGACLFLDEPTAALDLKHQYRLFELLKSLVAKQGLTVLAILHDITLARRYADSAVLMKNGRVQSAGNIKDVLNPGNIADVYDIPVMLAAEI